MWAVQKFYYSHLKTLPRILNIKYTINGKTTSNQWSTTRHKCSVSPFLFFFPTVDWGDSKVVHGQGSNTGHKLEETRNSSKLWRKLAEPVVWINFWLHTNLFFSWKQGKLEYCYVLLTLPNLNISSKATLTKSAPKPNQNQQLVYYFLSWSSKVIL